jgi:hypothetical protein
MKKCIFLLCVFLLGCAKQNPPLEKQSICKVREFLSSLPKEELLALDYFFRCLIQEDSVGYVLLGGKPMSIYHYIKPKPIVNFFPKPCLDNLDLFFCGFNLRDNHFNEALKIWKKYEQKFCGKNIFFNTIEIKQDLSWISICIINKRLLLSLFDRYLKQFRTLDPSIKNTEDLFYAFLHQQKFKKKFFYRDDLLGIALGYGERNAKLFQKRASILTSLGRLGFTLKVPSPEHLEQLQKEYSDIEKSFTSFSDRESRKLLFTFGVGFRADFSDPETLDLQKKYKNSRKTLTQTYCEHSFLEKTLELIMLADNL